MEAIIFLTITSIFLFAGIVICLIKISSLEKEIEKDRERQFSYNKEFCSMDESISEVLVKLSKELATIKGNLMP